VSKAESWSNNQEASRVHKTVLCQQLAEIATTNNSIVASTWEGVLVDLLDWAEEYFVAPEDYF
jgi:hypothetical protein